MKVVILEDELIISEKLKIIIETNGHEVIGQFDSAEDLLAFEDQFDLALLDINLNGKLDGIDFINRYSRKDEIAYIFISDIDEMDKIDRASTTHPVSYLSKPYKKKDLKIALKLANQKLDDLAISKKQKSAELTLIKDGEKLLSLDMKELLYIEGMGAYSKFILKNEERMVSQNLGSLDRKIKEDNIVRVHRSYIVNVNKIEEIKGKSSLVINGVSIPIGETYRSNLFDLLKIL
ncbi:MAG: response regulator transcription factor [Bacteroidota bacterium]